MLHALLATRTRPSSRFRMLIHASVGQSTEGPDRPRPVLSSGRVSVAHLDDEERSLVLGVQPPSGANNTLTKR
jgi:hypothetical protein